MKNLTYASEAIGDSSGFVKLRTGSMQVGNAKLAQSYTHDDLPPGEYVFVEVASVLESDPHTRFLQKPFTSESLHQTVQTALAVGSTSSS